jgi:hypothetical protein
VLDLANQQGEINVKSGQTELKGGLLGSNGALVRGVGTLTISGVSSLGGTLQVKSPTLVLAADNILPGGTIAMNGNTLSIGTTSQTLADLSGAKISGTGSISATTGGISAIGDIGAQLNAVNGSVSLSSGEKWWEPNATLSGAVSARDVVLSKMIANSSIAATGSLTADNSLLNGAISGTASLTASGSTVLTGQSTLTGATNVTGLTLQGNGALVSTSAVAVNGMLNLNYATVDTAVANRVNDSAALSLSNGRLALNETGVVASRSVEKIGALSIAGGSNSLVLAGNVGVLAESLSMQAGAKLYVDLGTSGSVKFVTAPVAVNGAVVNGVLVNRTTAQGVLPVWATYDATAGLQTEHVEGTLASAGTGIVRVTNATNQAVSGMVSVGAAVFDTTAAVTGSGQLETTKGLAFLQDNTLSVNAISFGSDSILSNAGTNTINGMLSGSTLEKLGQGTIALAGSGTFSTVSIGGGRLVVDGTLNANVSNYSQSYDSLTIRGAGRVTGNMDQVTLEGTGSYASTSNQSIGTVTLAQGSSFSNSGYVSTIRGSSAGAVITNSGSAGTIDVAAASSITNKGYARTVSTRGAGLINATGGSIESLINDTGRVTNSGSISYVDNKNGGMLSNSGTIGSAAIMGSNPVAAVGASINNDSNSQLTNTGAVTANYVNNSGQITNGGTFTLLAGGRYDSFGSGSYTQTAGTTTVDGTFSGDILLQSGTLNGWGAVTGNVTVMNGAMVRPGHSPGTMAINNLTLEDGAVLDLDVSTLAGGTSDRLVIDGLFNAKAGSRITFKITDNAGATADVFQSLKVTDYFTFASGSAPTANLFSNVNFLAQGTDDRQFSLTVNSDGSVASVTAVPEPETYAMFLAGLGLLGAIARRKRKGTVA